MAGLIITVIGGLILAFLLTNRDVPPGNGVFVKMAAFYYVELPRIRVEVADDVRLRAQGVPVIANRRPTLVVWEPRLDLGNLVLDEEVGGIGVQLGFGYFNGTMYPKIDSVTGGGGASQAGIQTNDLIVAVDRFPTDNYDTGQVTSLLRGPVGAIVNVTVNRGGSTYQFAITRVPIDTRGPVPMDFSSDQDKVFLTPSSDLMPGTHCLAAGSFLLPYEMVPHWCFVVP